MEAGWAPWVLGGDVHMNATYSFDSKASWFWQNAPNMSPFCAGTAAGRRRKKYAVWVPWVKNLDALKPNSRCSLGGAMLLRNFNMQRIASFDEVFSFRPVIRFGFGPGRDINFVVLLVHLIGGYRAGAQAELDALTASMSKNIPETASGIIVGDMNINLLNTNLLAPNNWRILRITPRPPGNKV